jgi:hypothetical protein
VGAQGVIVEKVADELVVDPGNRQQLETAIGQAISRWQQYSQRAKEVVARHFEWQQQMAQTFAVLDRAARAMQRMP